MKKIALLIIIVGTVLLLSSCQSKDPLQRLFDNLNSDDPNYMMIVKTTSSDYSLTVKYEFQGSIVYQHAVPGVAHRYYQQLGGSLYQISEDLFGGWKRELISNNLDAVDLGDLKADNLELVEGKYLLKDGEVYEGYDSFELVIDENGDATMTVTKTTGGILITVVTQMFNFGKVSITLPSYTD